MAATGNKPRPRDLLLEIRERYQGLSESHRKVAKFVLENLEVATFLSLNELSARIGVSDATLIRFAQELGFGGFKEFRENLADYIRKIIYSRMPPVEEKGGDRGLLERVTDADVAYVQRTMQAVSPGRLEQWLDLVTAAEGIYCMGWRISSFLAEFLAFQLRRVGYRAQALVRERRTLLEQVLDLGRGDLLIVFDQLLYSTEVFEAVEYLGRQGRGVKIVTVTTDPLAQIVQYADLSFFLDLSGQRDFSIISLTAPMCLINALVEGVIARDPQKARRALSRYEKEVLSRRQHAMILNPKTKDR